MNLVLSWSAPGSGDWSPPEPQLHIVNPVATCPSPGHCDCGPTWTSPGSGVSGSHMGLSWTWFLWSPSGLTWNTMTLIHIWASPGPVDSGPYLGIIGTSILSYIPGPHLDLVNLFPIWASPSPGDFVPHLDLIAVDSFLASPGTGDSDPICASPRPGDSGPHLGIIGTW